MILVAYVCFCFAFGMVFYSNFSEIRWYETSITISDIFMILFFGFLTPIFITFAIASWCYNQLKTL